VLKLQWQSLCLQQNCPKWLFEKKVQQVKAERGISFIEARKIVTAESEGRPAQGGRTTAAVVASKSTSPSSSLSIHANEPPLYVLRKKLSIQYSLKLSSHPQNTSYNTVFNSNLKVIH